MKLRVLHLEDSPEDVELIRRVLSKEWPECHTLVASNQAEFRDALLQGGFDLILGDYRIPGFDGLSALALARQHYPETPFIFISGTMGEDLAVEALKTGAADYVLKERLVRLTPAVRRALQEAEERARLREAEEKVQRMQAQLKQSNGDLLRRNQEIQNFYHTLSHELKTPLTSAREFISIVMDGLAGPLSERQLEYLGIARESCDQLRLCINDLIDATRLETGKLTIELKPTCLSALLQRVMTASTPGATGKGISLRLEVQPELPQLPLDEHRMTQVITNLLNNAIKFTPSRGQIVIRAGDAPDDPQLVEVSVHDTGCGIPAEEHSRIFDRLYQIKAGDATTEQGVGLGLYLCRELVQLHGGEIRVESQPGEGSTFSFTLPKSERLLRPNLLVIDDDRQIREMLHQLFEKNGYNVHTATGGNEALQSMRKQTPEVILLDLGMPELDGPATLKQIRKDWGNLPVIVYTADAESELVKRALEFSPFILLAKPCSPAQLLETVRKIHLAGDTEIRNRNRLRPVPTQSDENRRCATEADPIQINRSSNYEKNTRGGRRRKDSQRFDHSPQGSRL